MKLWHRILASALVGMLLVSSLGLSACFGSSKKESLTLPDAVISPPDIAEPGVLRVGVDSSRAPFAGVSESKIIGIDVDVAAALSEQMGLKLQIIDVKGQENVSNLLRDGTIDICMGVQGDAAASFTEAQVGPYLVDGPAIFTVSTSDDVINFDLNQLYGSKIAAQENSLSAWQVGKDYGDENVLTFASLQDAFSQLKSGTVTYAAADAIVGSFLAVKSGNIRCVTILDQPKGVYMGVAANRQELINRITESLRAMRDDGRLQVIVAKWLGQTSAQSVLSGEAIVSFSPGGRSSDAVSVETTGTGEAVGSEETAEEITGVGEGQSSE